MASHDSKARSVLKQRPNTGGAAFPVADSADMVGTFGMSLLDWFAGQALPAVQVDRSSGKDHVLRLAGQCPGPFQEEKAIAIIAYEQAAAMLAEKKRREGGE